MADRRRINVDLFEQFDQGFFFEPTSLEEEKEEQLSDHSDLLEDDDDLFEEEEIFKIADKAEEEVTDEGVMELKSKKEYLQKQAKDRVERLKGISGHDIDTDTFKEKLDVPAYLRKKVIFEKSLALSQAPIHATWRS